jgi:TolB protein
MYLDANGQVRKHEPLTTGQAYKDEQPAWSPTGEWIAVASQSLGADTNPWEIWLIDPDNGQNRRQVTKNGMRSSAARWSPDGERLVFALGHEEAEDICIVNKDGTGPVCHRTPWKEDLPSWSPDGNWIAFDRFVDDKDRTEVFIMRPDFTDERRLTYNSADDWGPMWVPQ